MRLDEIPPPDGLPAPVKELVRRLDTDEGVRHLWWTIVAVGVLALAVFVGRGGSRPKDPSFDGRSSMPVPALLSHRPAILRSMATTSDQLA